MNYAGHFVDEKGNIYYPETKEFYTSNSKTLTSRGWYRVAEFKANDYLSFLATIVSRYYYTNNVSITLSINTAHKASKITKISSQMNSSVISEVRISQKSDNSDIYYLEVYYNSDSQNQVIINFLMLNVGGNSSQTPLKVLPFEAIETGEKTVARMPTTEVNLENYIKNGWEFHYGYQFYIEGRTAHLNCAVKKGTSTIAFVLPDGYRPPSDMFFPASVNESGSVGYIQISPNGTLYIPQANVGKLNFINISYRIY